MTRLNPVPFVPGTLLKTGHSPGSACALRRKDDVIFNAVGRERNSHSADSWASTVIRKRQRTAAVQDAIAVIGSQGVATASWSARVLSRFSSQPFALLSHPIHQVDADAHAEPPCLRRRHKHTCPHPICRTKKAHNRHLTVRFRPLWDHSGPARGTAAPWVAPISNVFRFDTDIPI